MAGTWVVVAVLLAAGGGAGFAVYELLVRRYAPAFRVRAAAGGAPRRAEATRRKEAASGRASAALLAASRRLERLLPMTRADGEAYRALLARAGWGIEPETWRGLRILAAAGCGLVAAALAAAQARTAPLAAGGLVAVGAVIGWWAPRLALERAAVRRRRAVEAQLPDAMELLGIAIAAGSPVEQCFREVAENLDQPLSGEFEIVDREVNLLGHSREQALEHLAARCASRDVSAFTAQLAQAVSQGSSIAEGLSSQAALAREMAQAAALERIRKMPTKLDVVLSFCFLPPTIALVIVPTVVNLLKFLNDTLQ